MDYPQELSFIPPVSLDAKDKKILIELQQDARLSISAISRRTGIPRDVVKYRIRRLQEQKVIRFTRASLNPSALGYPLYAYALISIFNIEPLAEKKFISFLKSHPKMVYVAKFSGKWDFALGILAKDHYDLDTTLHEVRDRFPKVLKEIDVAPVIQEYKYDWMADLL